MQLELIDNDRACPFCGYRVSVSRLTCPKCGGNIYTELVRQEGIEVSQGEGGNGLLFTEPPELKNNSSYIFCTKGTTIKYVHQRKIHFEVCLHKCNRLLKCPTFQDALSERGLIQFQEALDSASDGKRKVGQVRSSDLPSKQRNRIFITLKKTDWRDIRTAVGKERLAEYRKARKMNTTSMAKKLGLAPRSYQRLENGNAPRVRRRLLAEIETKIVVQENKNHGYRQN